MATATNSPGTTVNLTGILPYSYSSWSDTDNAMASDDAYATTTITGLASANSDILYVSNFGFSIPSNAEISSVKFTIEGYASSPRGGIPNGIAGVTKNGTDFTWQTITIPTTEGIITTYSYPAAVSYTYTELNSSTFGVGITIYRGDPFPTTYSIDHIQCEITYSVPVSKTVSDLVSSVTETITVDKLGYDADNPSNSVGFILNMLTGYWTYSDSLPFNGLAFLSSVQKLIGARSDKGQISTINDGSYFDGTDIDAEIETGFFNLGDLDEVKEMKSSLSEGIKQLRRMLSEAKGEGDLIVTIYTEQDTDGKEFTLPLSNTDNSTINVIAMALSRGIRGKYFAMKINNSSGNDFWIGEQKVKIMPRAIR